jgi:prevent-host-death family protein
MSQSWQLQEAKNKFSEVVARAEAGELQIVTKHGVATAVVLSYAAYKKLSEPQRRLSELLRPYQNDGIALDIERNGTGLREDPSW